MSKKDTKTKNESKKKKLSTEKYEAEIYKLHTELVKLQYWVKETGQKVVVVFEGRDAAGKGGVIKRITERVSPRIFRVAALPSPSEREKTQMYGQRYMQHFPAAGEVVLFDRSWYNRAGVERGLGFCTEEDVERFFEQLTLFENMLVPTGIRLITYWFELSIEEQQRRFHGRSGGPTKHLQPSSTARRSHRPLS